MNATRTARNVKLGFILAGGISAQVSKVMGEHGLSLTTRVVVRDGVAFTDDDRVVNVLTEWGFTDLSNLWDGDVSAFDVSREMARQQRVVDARRADFDAWSSRTA